VKFGAVAVSVLGALAIMWQICPALHTLAFYGNYKAAIENGEAEIRYITEFHRLFPQADAGIA
jgi:hypothetical protein